MSNFTLILRAFRPSEFPDEGAVALADMTRLENIQRYARIASEGLRLFEDTPPPGQRPVDPWGDECDEE